MILAEIIIVLFCSFCKEHILDVEFDIKILLLK